MNQKELSELKRRFRPDKSAIHRIYGCFVNGNQEIVSYLDESMGRMPEEESAQYLGFLKKALSGTLGKQLIDIVFSTQQVADSQEHKLLSALRDSQLKDAQARETFYRKIIDALELDGNYLILLAHDAYDVPRRGKDDRLQEDSDTVFSYLVCCVCPVKDSKVELGYFPGENEFHSRAGQVVAPPELGFLPGRQPVQRPVLLQKGGPDPSGVHRRRLPHRAPHVRRRAEGGLPVRPAGGAGGRLHGGGGPGHP